MTANTHGTASSPRTGPAVPGDLFARRQTITGLRALADFLEANPDVPVAEYGQNFNIFTGHSGLDDTAAVAQVDQVAELLGVSVFDRRDRGGHYSATRSFGRIAYTITHIPTRALDDFNARTSYENNIVTTPGSNSPERAA